MSNTPRPALFPAGIVDCRQGQEVNVDVHGLLGAAAAVVAVAVMRHLVSFRAGATGHDKTAFSGRMPLDLGDD